jgi:predicted nuclease of predicted toxin-antitoxin system
MKLLFDQNLSPRLVNWLADIFPGASHTSFIGLDHEEDADVWEYARANDYIIVTKDADFNDFPTLRGFPPKIIWLRLGNCTARHVEVTLRSHMRDITALSTDPNFDILVLL